MAGKDIISMSVKELKRLPIIQKVIARDLTQLEASYILSLCTRQIRRIIRRVRSEGEKGLIHRSRTKQSNRAKPAKIKNKILRLCNTRYKGFNPTFASEKLFEIDELIIHPETLRLWFKEAHIEYKRRKGRKHRSWRERKHHFGEMIQIDGSHHDWFEGRGEKCVLMGYIDDATGTVLARFYEYEGTYPFMDSFKHYSHKYGLPYSVYIDKHTTYKSTKKPSIEDELENREPLSEVGRALKELGIEVIYAHSAPAKGRIERLFETFQDRLIKEMRLRKIKTIRQANKFLEHYLPVFNRRFSIQPIEKAGFHRRLPEDIDLDAILCIKTERALRNDFTVAHNKKLYQIMDRINAQKVIVEDRLDGRMFISYKGRQLNYKKIILRQKKKQEPKPYVPIRPKRPYIPPLDHPWKKPLYEARYKHYPHNKQKEKVAQKEKGLLLTVT